MRRAIFLTLILTLALGVLAGCSSAPKQDPAAAAVEAYLNALIGKDAAKLSALSCADWEPQATLELDSFQAVTARLDGLACTKSGDENGAALVTCAGKIVATYNNEDQDLDLAERTYLVKQEGGDWRVCGYK